MGGEVQAETASHATLLGRSRVYGGIGDVIAPSLRRAVPECGRGAHEPWDQIRCLARYIAPLMQDLPNQSLQKGFWASYCSVGSMPSRSSSVASSASVIVE